MNHLGNALPQGHLPHQMMGPTSRLLTTAPPVSVVNAVSPLQIQLSPNTQMQQAMAAAAAAFSPGRPFVQQQPNGMPHNTDPEARFVNREFRRSPELPVQSTDNIKHVRRISESSFASSGFASSGSPVSHSPSASPKKQYLSKYKAQENFVSKTLPYRAIQSEIDDNQMSQKYLTVNQHRESGASPVSMSPRLVQPGSSPERSYSPSSSISDNDSDSVWRPW